MANEDLIGYINHTSGKAPWSAVNGQHKTNSVVVLKGLFLSYIALFGHFDLIGLSLVSYGFWYFYHKMCKCVSCALSLFFLKKNGLLGFKNLSVSFQRRERE